MRRDEAVLATRSEHLRLPGTAVRWGLPTAQPVRRRETEVGQFGIADSGLAAYEGLDVPVGRR
jgi:hypothetical protein